MANINIMPRYSLKNVISNHNRYYDARVDNTKVNKPIVVIPESGSLPVDRTWYNKIGIGTHDNPVYYLARDLATKHLGVKPKTFTENDVSNTFLNELDKQVRHTINTRNNPNISRGYFAIHPNDTIYMGVNGHKVNKEMYNKEYGDTKESIIDKVTDPAKQIEHTLGSYGVKIYKDGYEVFDDYDFNKGSGKTNSKSVYSAIRRFAKDYGSQSTDPRNKVNKFSIKRKINHW